MTLLPRARKNPLARGANGLDDSHSVGLAGDQRSRSSGRCMTHAEYSLRATRSNRVRQLDELPLELEPLGKLLGQRFDAELLGRVMPGGDEVDPELLGEVEARFGGLAGQVQVVALGGRLRQVALSAAGDDRDATEVLGAFGEDEWLAADPLAHPGEELVARGRHAASEAPLEERAVDLDAEFPREQRVVADLRMGVEREVIAGEVDVRLEQGL